MIALHPLLRILRLGSKDGLDKLTNKLFVRSIHNWLAQRDLIAFSPSLSIRETTYVANLHQARNNLDG